MVTVFFPAVELRDANLGSDLVTRSSTDNSTRSEIDLWPQGATVENGGLLQAEDIMRWCVWVRL